VGAVALYVWNAGIGGAFHFPLQALEVGLRNALHRELSILYGEHWYSANDFLELDASEKEPLLRQLVEKAHVKLRNKGKVVDPPHTVAALEFGFWTYLVSKHFEPTLWAPGLRKAFPLYERVTGVALKIGVVSNKLNYVRAFRNRIAHHEPIFQRDLNADYETILDLCSWMFEDLRAWVDHHSDVRRVLASKPLPTCETAHDIDSTRDTTTLTTP